MEKKTLYYLPPERYYYDYTIEACALVSTVNQKGLYCRAYTIKQARTYFIRRIAFFTGAITYDIDIDISDIVER